MRFFLLARGWPYLLIMLMRKRSDRLAKTSEWGPNFPWTARLIICPWDTRSIMATGIASYPFYAKWERAIGWPFGTGWPSALGWPLPNTPDTSRDHSRTHKASFAPLSHRVTLEISRWATHRAVRSAFAFLCDDCRGSAILFNTLFYSYDSKSVFLLQLLRIWYCNIDNYHYTYYFIVIIFVKRRNNNVLLIQIRLLLY